MLCRRLRLCIPVVACVHREKAKYSSNVHRAGETSRLRSLTPILAKKKRKLVKLPVERSRFAAEKPQVTQA
jgi:hypothetical protein